MEPLSITTGCLSLVGTITKVSLTINTFVRTARQARIDLDSISRELLSLKTVLELLAEDTQEKPKAIPQTLEKQISSIISNCDGVLQDIEKSLQKYEEGKLKSMKWAWDGRDDMARLRTTLEAHKSALELALDMVALSVIREVKVDTTEIKADAEAIKQDTTQILVEIARLQAQLPQDAEGVGSRGYMLQRYLDDMTSYAETVVNATINSSEPVEEENAVGVASSNDERSGQDLVEEVHKLSGTAAAGIPDFIVLGKPPQGSGSPSTISPNKLEEVWESVFPSDDMANALLIPDNGPSQQEAAVQTSPNPPSSTQEIQGNKFYAGHGDDVHTVVHTVASRQPTVVHRDMHVKSSEGLLKQYNDSAGEIEIFGYLDMVEEAFDIRSRTTADTPPLSVSFEDDRLQATADDVNSMAKESQQNSDDSANASKTPQPKLSTDDRWAQIRRNAAERALAESAQPARRAKTNNGETIEGGETTDEETIEARVARIKKRVAELTGNFDAQTNVIPTEKPKNDQPMEGNLRDSRRRLQETLAASKSKSPKTTTTRSSKGPLSGLNGSSMRGDPRQGDQSSENVSSGTRMPTPQKSLVHARRESLQAHRDRQTLQKVSNISKGVGPDQEVMMTIKPHLVTGFFRISITSRKPLPFICADIIRVLKLFSVDYDRIEAGLTCTFTPKKDVIVTGHKIIPPPQPGVVDSNSWQGLPASGEIGIAEENLSLTLRFEILVVKKLLWFQHGLQFKRLEGNVMEYSNLKRMILYSLRI